MRTSHSPSQAAGFSLIEVLIAAAVLLIITLGVLPMFVNAISNNVEGADLTQLVHQGTGQVEALIQAGLDDALLDTSGGTNVTTQLWGPESRRWVEESAFPPDENATMRRVIRVSSFQMPKPTPGQRNYQNSDGSWMEFDDIATEVSGAVPSQVRRIEVVVDFLESSRNILAPRRQLTLRFFKTI